MAGFLFALLATFIAGIGARDQVLVAALAARQGARPLALMVALACVLATATLAVLAADLALPRMGLVQRQYFAALALALAGLEMVFARRTRVPDEPTDSLGAFAIVLFAQQLFDAGRFLIVAIAVATTASLAAGLGGALGGGGVVAAGWLGGTDLLGRNLAPWRRACGVLLLLVAGWTALNAR